MAFNQRKELACLLSGCTLAAAQPKMRAGGSMIINAPGGVVTMDPHGLVYAGIQISGGVIANLSAKPLANPTLDLSQFPKATIYPGFIDSHSHAISLLTAQSVGSNGAPNWVSLANVNVMLLKPCGGATPTGSTTCFTPVRNQQQVKDLLSSAKPNAAGWVLGWNYEPSRMICSDPADPTKMLYGFQCPNFENQNQMTALDQMDAIRKDVPMMVTSESGHIVYVNRLGLAKLDICNLAGATATCYPPLYNPAVETALAATGQLDEDLALHAISKVEELLATDSGNPTQFYAKQIQAALALYSQLGYTTVQEGAASGFLINTYKQIADQMARQTPPAYLPATIAFLQYDGTTAARFKESVAAAVALRKALDGYDMFIAGMKVYTDGSIQGYTGAMESPVFYQNLQKPFTDKSIFPNGYNGLPDYNEADVSTAAKAAHDGGFALWAHTNGNAAQGNVARALIPLQNDSPARDVVVHFTMPTKEQVIAEAKAGIGSTFLINDFYYFYPTVCDQILAAADAANFYPAGWTDAAGTVFDTGFGIHSDASVTPPSPMFAIWVATTRQYQKDWFPSVSEVCRKQGISQTITRLAALRAYTSSAAWLYNRNYLGTKQPAIGSLQGLFRGDLVILSEDPADPATDLSKVYVLYTIHNGNIVYPPPGTGPGTGPPIWPN
jgi:predicted amidohydrolase YtcJ